MPPPAINVQVAPAPGTPRSGSPVTPRSPSFAPAVRCRSPTVVVIKAPTPPTGRTSPMRRQEYAVSDPLRVRAPSPPQSVRRAASIIVRTSNPPSSRPASPVNYKKAATPTTPLYRPPCQSPTRDREAPRIVIDGGFSVESSPQPNTNSGSSGRSQNTSARTSTLEVLEKDFTFEPKIVRTIVAAQGPRHLHPVPETCPFLPGEHWVQALFEISGGVNYAELMRLRSMRSTIPAILSSLARDEIFSEVSAYLNVHGLGGGGAMTTLYSSHHSSDPWGTYSTLLNNTSGLRVEDVWVELRPGQIESVLFDFEFSGHEGRSSDTKPDAQCGQSFSMRDAEWPFRVYVAVRCPTRYSGDVAAALHQLADHGGGAYAKKASLFADVLGVYQQSVGRAIRAETTLIDVKEPFTYCGALPTSHTQRTSGSPGLTSVAATNSNRPHLSPRRAQLHHSLNTPQLALTEASRTNVVRSPRRNQMLSPSGSFNNSVVSTNSRETGVKKSESVDTDETNGKHLVQTSESANLLKSSTSAYVDQIQTAKF